MEFSTLIQQPESLRDDNWEQSFLSQFAKLEVQLESEQAKQGPDGWPYLFVKTGVNTGEPVTKVMEWLAGRGIGMVVNAHKMLPDYVFPYGMVWNFVETGRFLQPEIQARSGDAVYAPDSQLLKGPPSEKYLPPYVRSVLKRFLAAQGFHDPQVLVISTADFKEVDLVFSVESLNGLARADQAVLAERLAWFLPLHYTLVLGEQKGLPAFYPL